MTVKKIYGTLGCHQCTQAKKQYPEAEYKDMKDVSQDEYEKLIEKAKEKKQFSLPLLLDESGNLLALDILA